MDSGTDQPAQVSDPLCNVHGWIGHAAVREAARALAAVEMGTRFERISVVEPEEVDNAAPNRHDESRLGGMRLQRAFAEVARSSPVEAFQLSCSGALGERAVLRHYLDVYWENDLRAFRTVVGLTRPVSRDELDAVLGENAFELANDVQAWARENAERIRAVAWVLTRAEPSDGLQVLHYSRDWSLTEEDVTRLVHRPDDAQVFTS